MTSPHFRKCLSRMFWRGTPGSKKTWSISFSTQPKNGLRGCCCCWPILERKAEPEPILAKISQETLAEMIGTTRSRVSHFMNKFRQLGFIDYNGHLEVHNSLVSVLLADQPRTVSPPKLYSAPVSLAPHASSED